MEPATSSYNMRNLDTCSDYAAQPLEPNGRFELDKKICLSITGYYPEYWLPAWEEEIDDFGF
nr:15159_t:CDS:2 [Entrophospora candida]CAG8439415.1 9651_t:CDS:2 [Entrophospora candida]